MTTISQNAVSVNFKESLFELENIANDERCGLSYA